MPKPEFNPDDFEDFDDESCEGFSPIDKTEHLNELGEGGIKRLQILMNNQTSINALRTKMEKEIAEIELKYQALFAPLYQRRSELAQGGEVQDSEVPETFMDAPVASKEEFRKDMGKNPLPSFWFHAMRNCDELRAILEFPDTDKDALTHLIDIRSEKIPPVEVEREFELPVGDDEDEDEEEEEEGKKGKKEKKEKKETKKIKRTFIHEGFKLIFQFDDSNPYFPEKVLTKTYHISHADASSSSDIEMEAIECDHPTWNNGKDLTKKLVTKTVKTGKGKKAKTKKVTVEEPQETFFNFFFPPPIPKPEDMDDADEEKIQKIMENQNILQMDLQAAQLILESVIPSAVLFFAGVVGDDDDDDDDDMDFMDGDDDDDEDGDEDDEDEDDDDNDDDDDGDDNADNNADNSAENGGPAPVKIPQETPPECQQQ